MPSKTLSVAIDLSIDAVGAFLAKPSNFEKWASGLGKGLKQIGGEWIIEAPEGAAKVRFAPENPFGIADHSLEFGDGGKVYIPIRAIVNGSGSEVMLTVFQKPGTDDDEFDEDCAWVARDLKTLKSVLEGTAV